MTLAGPDIDRCLTILVVEDDDTKFTDVEVLLAHRLSSPYSLKRAKTVTEAEDDVSTGDWSLMILDISMDISPGSRGPVRAGHATLGGLDVVERLFLFDISIPTVILTGFDSFSAQATHELEVLGIEDIEARANEKLGRDFLGCVRYGSPGWQDLFVTALGGLDEQ